jgi:hypothetical protein
MDSKTKTLVNLIDDALQIAEDRMLRREAGAYDLAPLSGLEMIVAALHQRREMALAGTLKPFEGHNSVGLNRELLEWGEWGTELFKAIESIEDFYSENF